MLTTPTTKKVSRAQRKIFFEAIILTLLLHGLLVVLFVYTPSTKVYSNIGTAGVTFMNLANQSPKKRQELLNWLEYNDPSLISAPNAKYGYNQLHPRVNFRGARPDTNYRNVLPESRKNSPKKFMPLNSHQQAGNNLSQNFIFHRPGQIQISVTVKQRPPLPQIKYPLIKRGDIVLNISLAPALVQKALESEAKAMDINFRPGQVKLLPRVVIVNSSGQRDFDNAVLRELLLQINKISPDRKAFKISIQWRKEALK